MSYFADQDVYRRFEKHNYVLSHSLIAMEFSAAGDHLTGGSFMKKELNERLFPVLCGVVVRCSRVESKGAGFESYRVICSHFLFFPVFCVVVFYKYIAKLVVIKD